MSDNPRIDGLEDDNKEFAATLAKHGEQLAVLNIQIPALQKSVDELTKTMSEHNKQLSEYKGAQKMVHWLVTAGIAIVSSVGAYIFGSNGGKA